jgi:transcriptional regulator GlxA family with amidase domain
MRSLQLVFRAKLDCSPVQYVRNERLKLAHYLLKTAPDGAQVSQIACDVGLPHLGRFSVAYRHKFGQSPSATLSQA